ncbi:MAG TPA: hypothetical protein PKA17_02095 [Phenylobacterium sp.]|nr:hypothetical protein [Phenylobacterium sp.]
MLMRKNKAEQPSSLRFCQKAVELPYGFLWSYREFTVALSGTRQLKIHPPGDSAPTPEAIGLLHGGSMFIDGSEEPLLPVRLEFVGSPRERDFESHLGDGCLNKHYGQRQEFYYLDVRVCGPGLRLFRDIDAAVERAALSGQNYLHIRCAKSRETMPLETGAGFSNERYDEEKAFLKAVDAGEKKLSRVIFDEVLFMDRVNARSPAWSYSWPEYESDAEIFHSKGVAKHRAQRLKWVD